MNDSERAEMQNITDRIEPFGIIIEDFCNIFTLMTMYDWEGNVESYSDNMLLVKIEYKVVCI